WLLPRRVGEVRARELLLLGRALSGAEAAEWGAIHRAVPGAELDAAAGEVVGRLASGPTVALGLTKWLLSAGANAELHAQLAHGGLDLSPEVARAIDVELRPFNLGRLNPLGLNNTAPALYAYGSEQQRLRFLPPMVRNEEKWCQLFSEPGAGSDLASLATRAERDGDMWGVTGQKVWSTWAHFSDFAILLARTDPDAPKRQGITYFLLDLHQPGVEVRPLR